MHVPLFDLKAQYKTIEQEIRAAIDSVLETQHFIMGPQVKSLEEQIAKYVGAKHGVACASGSDALLLALMALGVNQGDEIITTPYTFFATAGAIARLGAKTIFVDIDPKTYNIDPNCIEDALQGRGIYGSRVADRGSRIKAIIPVHLYGQSADMDSIMEIVRGRGVAVIEDAAQAIGTEHKGRRVGSIGDFGCFSFFPSKNLGGIGDGGMVTTNNDDYADKLRVLRVHGSKPKYYHKVIGLNSRLDTINAAVLDVKLRHLDRWSKSRKANADWYNKAFMEAGLVDYQIITPYEAPAGRHIYNQYVIRAKNRDELQNYLKSNEVGCEVYYPVPLHRQECFSCLGYKDGDCPISEDAARETLAIPVYPELTDEQRRYAVEVINNFYSKK